MTRRRCDAHLLSVRAVALLFLATACGGGREDGLLDITGEVDVRANAGHVVVGDGGVWVGHAEGVLLRFDPVGGRLDTVRLGPIGGLALGHGAVWAGDRDAVVRIDPATAKVVARSAVEPPVREVTTGEGAVWATTSGGRVIRIDPRTNRVSATVPVAQDLGGLAAGEGAVWVALRGSGEVARLDPGSARVQDRIAVGPRPDALTVGLGSVWVADTTVHTVSRIDPGTGKVTAAIQLPAQPAAIQVGAGAVWVAGGEGRGVVWRLDPASNQVSHEKVVDGSLQALAVGADSVWALRTGPSSKLVRLTATPGSLRTALPRPTGPPVLEYARSGGIAGFLDNLAVDLGTGEATLTGGVGAPRTFTVATGQLEQLRRLFDEKAFSKLRGSGPGAGTDRIVYTLTYAGRTVGIGADSPDSITALLTVLGSIVDEQR